MSHFTVAEFEKYLLDPERSKHMQKDENGEPYYYVEIGRYKPFMPATIAAARRRGFRCVPKGRSTYYVYAPRSEPTEADWLAALGPCGK